MNIYWHPWFGAIFTTFGYLFVSFVLFQSFIDVMKGATSVQFSLFSIIHPTQTQFWRRKKIAFLFNFHFFIPPHPNQIKFWNNFAFMFYSHFSNHSSHPIPPKKRHKLFRISFWYWSINMPKKSEGGWSGIGMANSGIHPTHVLFLNDHPTQIPPSEILGPVVQNCLALTVQHGIESRCLRNTHRWSQMTEVQIEGGKNSCIACAGSQIHTNTMWNEKYKIYNVNTNTKDRGRASWLSN